MLQKLQTFFYRRNPALLLFLLLPILATVQALLLGAKQIGGQTATHYNNYVIYKNAFFHLCQHRNLYLWFPAEQWDQFKYMPTYAAFFAIFAAFPDWLGLSIWNILNAIVLFLAIFALPLPNATKKSKMALFVILELITSLQNHQTNALNVGLMLLGFAFLEQKKYFWAVFFIVCTFYIKIYGIAIAVIWLFYDNKIKNLAYGIFWLAVLGVVPLLFVPLEQLRWQYVNYGQLIQEDHGISYGLSLINVMRQWFAWELNKIGMITFGLLASLSPLVWVKKYDSPTFRYVFVGMFLIFLIIFNHKSESPTFILAAVGVALWYFSQEKSRFNFILLILTVFFSWLAPTDLYPPVFRKAFFEPYCIKVIPCFFVWLKALYDLHFSDFDVQKKALTAF